MLLSSLAVSRRPDGLHLEMDAQIVAHEDSAGLQRLIPGQPEVATVDLRIGGEAHARVPPRIAAASLVGGVERHLARRAADREVADDPEAVALVRPGAFDPAALEGNRRELLHVQEVGRAQVLVALLDAGVDAG